MKTESLSGLKVEIPEETMDEIPDYNDNEDAILDALDGISTCQPFASIFKLDAKCRAGISLPDVGYINTTLQEHLALLLIARARPAPPHGN
ncbi:hypothetical protein ACHAPT_003215 [Fusarium lateritium]